MGKTLIILGMHRSGTSLTANWLESCGLQIGDDLVGPHIGNKEGHFEDRDFHSLHEKILESHGIERGGLRGNVNVILSKKEWAEIQNLVEKKKRGNIQWGWKEPRTCLFLDAYRKILPEAKYLVVYRNYSEVVDSLLRREFKLLKKDINRSFFRGKFNRLLKVTMSIYRPFWVINNRETFLKSWMKYNSEIFKHLNLIEGESFLCISIENLIENDRDVFNHLKSWGFNLNYFPINNIYNEKLLKEKKAPIHFEKKLKNQADQILKSLADLSPNFKKH